MDHSITIIIPTLANTARGPHLLRAVKSVLALDVPAVASVIINGERQDEAVVRAVREAGALVHRSDTLGVSAARLLGRQQVETPLFGFLDDDDVLLPNAGTERSHHFSDASIDVVVGNGYIASLDGRRIPFCELPTNTADAARSILKANWLASPAAFFRTASVDATAFMNLPNVMEWTVLGFRLAVRYKIRFSPAFTYVICQDAPDRSTKTRTYVEQAPDILRRLQRENKRKDLEPLLAQKIRAAHHTAADYSLWNGELSTAWRHHLASMRGPGPWVYGGLTLRLIKQQLRALRDRARAAVGDT
jgi:hypothetical protein